MERSTLGAGRRPGSLHRTVALVWPAMVLVLLLGLRFSRLMERLELMVLDAQFEARGVRQPQRDDIVVVDIDEPSLEIDGRRTWPLPRRYHAQVLRRLKQAGARTIGVDVFFFGPSPSPKDDQELADTIAECGNVYLAAQTYGGGEQPAERSLWERFSLGKAPPGGLIEVPNIEVPSAPFAAAAKGIGFVDVHPDPDNTLRRVALVLEHEGELLPSLSLALARDVTGAGPGDLEVDWGHELRLAGRRFEINRSGLALLDFLGPGIHEQAGGRTRSPFTHYSYLDVYRGATPPGAFRNKIVLVGWTAKGVNENDHFATPFDRFMPGVEVHATALDNLLGRGTLQTARPQVNFLVLAALVLLPAMILARLPVVWGTVLTVLLGLAFWRVDVHLFRSHRLFLDVVVPLSGLLLVYVGETVVRLAGVEQRQKVMRRAFEFYVAPEVLQRLMASGEDLLSLDAAERREVTVLFADVVGFTAMSEVLEPEAVTKTLNEYFTDMADILLRHGAYLDKFMGDCVMAVFNVFPQAAHADHALRAVSAAVEMQARTRHLREAAERRGDRAFTIGVGINTGWAVAGNMGSARQAQYSVIGDSVNLASRVEAMCRQFGAEILITEHTWSQCDGRVQTGQEVEAPVRGRTQAVKVYEVLGLRDA